MKHKKTVQLLSHAIKYCKLTGSETKILVCWANHAINYHPTTKQLALESGLAQPNVSRALKSLCKKEALHKTGVSPYGAAKYEFSALLRASLNIPKELEEMSIDEEIDACYKLASLRPKAASAEYKG